MLGGSGLEIDRRATDELRESMRRNRKPLKLFDFGERKASATSARAAHSN